MPGADSIASVHSVWIEVDDNKIGDRALLDGGENALHASFRDKAEGRSREAKPGRAHPDLVRGFLAGKIERAVALGGNGGGGLEQQRRFADARLTAQEHGGPLREPLSDGAVEFGDPRCDAPDIAAFGGKAFDGCGLGSALGFQADPAGRGERATFLHKAVPCAAGGAFALPFAGRSAAGLANVILRDLYHRRPVFLSWPPLRRPSRAKGVTIGIAG